MDKGKYIYNKVYNPILLLRYINGDIINEYDIDQLESDWEFIAQVLEYSGDKNLYNICDNELKSKLPLMKIFVDKFYKDVDFIKNKVINNFKNNVKDSRDYYDLLAYIVENVERVWDDDEIRNLRFELMINLCSDMNMPFNIFNSDKVYKIIYIKGFKYLFVKYYDNHKTLLDYYSKLYISDIINVYNLEKEVHKKYITKEEYAKDGYINFILEYVANKDEFFSEYLEDNIYLLADYLSIFNRIQNNFDKYNDIQEMNMVNWILENIYDIAANDFTTVGGNELAYYIAKDLKIEKLLGIENLPKIRLDEIYDKQFFDNKIEYHNLIKKILNVIKTREIPDSYVQEECVNYDSQVVNFERRNKKGN